jgi:taurine dioxygenase
LVPTSLGRAALHAIRCLLSSAPSARIKPGRSAVLNAKSGPRIRHQAPEGSPYETLTVDKLTPVIGAEIHGVNLSAPLSDRQLAEIHRALAENLVIFFRDQALTPERHLAFGRLFGDLHVHPAAPHEGDTPELMIIHADKDSPRANGEGWHSDVSCDLEPPMGTILHITQCPPKGGDTLFASMYAAYEALSARMQAYLAGLTAVHDGEHVYRGLFANFGEPDRPSYPRAEHPVIRTHPVTAKKALYVNRGFTTRILGTPSTRATRSCAISTSTWRTRCSSAASAGSRTPSPSGITAAPSTAPSGTTGRTPAPAAA